jgi:hexosaminidase
LPATLEGRELRDGGKRLSSTLDLPLRSELAQARRAGELKLCTENIAQGLEDDGPSQGPSTYFPDRYPESCWIYRRRAARRPPRRSKARVGNVPFNFQIGELKDKISFAKPQTPKANCWCCWTMRWRGTGAPAAAPARRTAA